MSFGGLEKPAGYRPMSEINVTPLVDVMLVLLVIFIIAAPFMASRLALDLPQAEQSEAQLTQEPDAFVSIAIDPQGQVFWDEEPISAEALKQRLQDTARSNPDAEVQLRADATVPYGRVVELIGLSQAAGLSRIGFVTDQLPGGLDAPVAPVR
jgi:biopolymer transport protein TolR